MAVKWFGKGVSAKMRAAQIAGVNATMGAAVVHAKQNHPWENQTGTLEGSYDIQDYAAATSANDGVRGQWGSRDVRYALIQELGGTIRPKTAKALRFPVAAGEFVTVKSVTIPARPTLRPAADAEYPNLARRIRRAYQRGDGR